MLMHALICTLAVLSPVCFWAAAYLLYLMARR
jgi:hypothetical protein